ncbi:MAG: hypothetical protein AAFV53_38310 [Myxococcota bacterium]
MTASQPAPTIHAPEDILRELIYGINVLFLESLPEVPSGPRVTERMFFVLRVEGPRLGAPGLLYAWRDAVGEQLFSLIAETIDLIMEELLDQEDPFSAVDILRLLQLEPFWMWTWDPYADPEGLARADIQPLTRRGTTLPLALRPRIVRILQRMEVDLFDLYQEQRSLYDQLESDVVQQHISAAVARIRALGQAGHVADLPDVMRRNAGQHIAMGDALTEVQRWKLVPEFDPGPDEDDGEWTWRILERLYLVSWVA